MKTNCPKLSLLTLLTVAISATTSAAGEPSTSPLYQGAYIAPMASYALTKDKSFDNGVGGMLSGGYRKDWWAIEATGRYEHYSGTAAEGGLIAGLVFPLKSGPNLYGVLGFGGLEIKRHAVIKKGYSLTTSEVGAGYIFPLSIGNYEFGLRADARYRYGHREVRVQPNGDLPIQRDFQDVLLNVGLQLPMGFKPAPVPPPVETVAVVPTLPQCSDGKDNDVDVKIDFPTDPGCKSAEDDDETDPPQCSDGKDNDGDGLIDFPADKGCTSVEDNDETDPPPPCMPPESNERVSLKGCGTGDIIVLRGVNFEFDKATLTANAKTILDGVASELLGYPEIKVELSGHTDARGSDVYNLRLSDKRAASVLKYLVGKGIAADRMTSIGYGETKPVADNETDAGRELNRRVELKITSGSATVAPTPPVATPPVEPSAATTVEPTASTALTDR